MKSINSRGIEFLLIVLRGICKQLRCYFRLLFHRQVISGRHQIYMLRSTFRAIVTLIFIVLIVIVYIANCILSLFPSIDYLTGIELFSLDWLGHRHLLPRSCT